MLFEEGGEETEDALPVFDTLFASVRECKGDCGCRLIPSNKPVSGGLDCLRRGDLSRGYDKVANLLCGFGVALCRIMTAKDSVEVKGESGQH